MAQSTANAEPRTPASRFSSEADGDLASGGGSLHQHQHNPTLFPCDECSQVFDSAKSLRVHVAQHKWGPHRIVEDADGGSRFQCLFDGCGKFVKDRKVLRKHCLTHRPREFECKACGKRFYERAKLKRHNLVHTGEKDFRCTFAGCGKCFAYKANLLTHMRTHTGHRPYKCTWPGCGKAFAQASNRNSHVLTHAQTRRKRSNSSRSSCFEPGSPISEDLASAVASDAAAACAADGTAAAAAAAAAAATAVVNAAAAVAAAAAATGPGTPFSLRSPRLAPSNAASRSGSQDVIDHAVEESKPPRSKRRRKLEPSNDYADSRDRAFGGDGDSGLDGDGQTRRGCDGGRSNQNVPRGLHLDLKADRGVSPLVTPRSTTRTVPATSFSSPPPARIAPANFAQPGNAPDADDEEQLRTQTISPAHRDTITSLLSLRDTARVISSGGVEVFSFGEAPPVASAPVTDISSPSSSSSSPFSQQPPGPPTSLANLASLLGPAALAHAGSYGSAQRKACDEGVHGPTLSPLQEPSGFLANLIASMPGAAGFNLDSLAYGKDRSPAKAEKASTRQSPPLGSQSPFASLPGSPPISPSLPPWGSLPPQFVSALRPSSLLQTLLAQAATQNQHLGQHLGQHQTQPLSSPLQLPLQLQQQQLQQFSLGQAQLYPPSR